MDRRLTRTPRATALSCLVALLVAGCLSSCATDAQPATSVSSEAQTQEAVPTGSVYVPEGETLAAFDDACLDRHGDITVFALCEMRGWELETLLQQQGYVWSAQDLTWVKGDGSVALIVRGADQSYLADDQISTLSYGAEEGVSYRMVTSAYSTPRRAVNALVANVMTCEDVERTDESAVAVAYGPSMRRVLVFANRSNDVIVLSVFGEEALAAGLLDEIAGQELGSTIDEAFASLAGRTPAAE